MQHSVVHDLHIMSVSIKQPIGYYIGENDYSKLSNKLMKVFILYVHAKRVAEKEIADCVHIKNNDNRNNNDSIILPLNTRIILIRST